MLKMLATASMSMTNYCHLTAFMLEANLVYSERYRNLCNLNFSPASPACFRRFLSGRTAVRGFKVGLSVFEPVDLHRRSVYVIFNSVSQVVLGWW